MSNNFIKNDIDDLLSSIQSENISLPQWINVVDIQNGGGENTETSDNSILNNILLSNTSTELNQQNGGNLSATSEVNPSLYQNNNFSVTSEFNDIFISQNGGNNENNNTSPDDINNLINMLTSEKVNNNFDTVTTITNTEMLENQLKEILGGTETETEQKGGAKKSSKKAAKKSSKKAGKKSSKKASETEQKGGAKKSSKKGTKKSSKKGAKKSSKKSSKKASKKSSKKASKKSSKKSKKSSKKSKKSSKKSSKKASKKSSSKRYKSEEKAKRSPNPALVAFAELSKHVAEKLGISNGPKAKKIAGAANKAIKEKFPDIGAVEVAKKAKEHFDENMNEFKKLLESLQ